jgi:apolipoprotein D and lipocalin family protein
MKMKSIKQLTMMLFSTAVLTACGGMDVKPISTVEHVDLNKFMGDWYVIANIPTFIETDAFNAVESYAMNDDGSIKTTFTFRKGSFDGARKQYNPTGFVRDTQSNALWDMQFIWPFKAEYRIIYLDSAYDITIIGRSKRDYVWIMARTPEISDEVYQMLLNFIAEQGYDTSLVQKVPQQWNQSRVEFNRSIYREKV